MKVDSRTVFFSRIQVSFPESRYSRVSKLHVVCVTAFCVHVSKRLLIPACSGKLKVRVGKASIKFMAPTAFRAVSEGGFLWVYRRSGGHREAM